MDGHPCAAIRLTHALLVPAGETRSEQLGALIAGMVEATGVTGRIGMVTDLAECLAAFRAFNDERVSCLPGSTAQARAVVRLLRALVGHLVEQGQDVRGTALDQLGWNLAYLPTGVE